MRGLLPLVPGMLAMPGMEAVRAACRGILAGMLVLREALAVAGGMEVVGNE